MMYGEFDTNSSVFPGQRRLTGLLLLLLAVGMVIAGIKEISSGNILAEDNAIQTAGIVPTHLTIPGLGFETSLGETSNLLSNGATGWLKSGPKPGESGAAVIVAARDWPVASLKTGNRLEVASREGKKLAFEITGIEQSASSSATAQPSADQKWLRLIAPETNSVASWRVITARLIGSK